MSMMKKHLVKPDSKIDLSDWDPNDTGAFSGGKEEAEEKLSDLSRRLQTLQELLYAGHKHKILIILQAMDTGGKDGTIRKVFSGVNPQGMGVVNFKAPTPEELDHDYLWRVHREVPGKGEMVIFNRSHYEDVLIVRVHSLVPAKVWRRRYAQINDFERTLAEEGTTIMKFFLHIDKDEQRKRLQERLDDTEKHWKFNVADLKERELWNDYMRAYEDALGKTSTQWAPWYIIPANRKWYRNLAVATTIVVETLERLEMCFPEPKKKLESVVIE